MSVFKIGKPKYVEDCGIARISSLFIIEQEQVEIFFETEAQYGKYLTHEVADAFVVGAILPALVEGYDIEVGCVTDALFYNFDTIVYLLGKVFDCKPIKLRSKDVVHTDFSATANAVGTGFSGGVDSFATYINHTGENCPESMRLTHLTLFNVGAYGNDYENTKAAFDKDLQRARDFAALVGKPLVPLNSNISSICQHKKIYHYSLRSTMELSCAVLALQKLFSVYYISSSGTIEAFKLSCWDQYLYEGILIQRLCNHNLNIYIAEHTLDRVEKTQLIMNNALVQNHLYVCAADIYNETLGTHFLKDTSPNCCECIKCTRTLLTLDFLGILERFSEAFDIEKWNKIRDREVVSMFINKEHDHFMGEVWRLFCERGHTLSSVQLQMIRQKTHIGLYRKVRRFIGSILRKLRLK